MHSQMCLMELSCQSWEKLLFAEFNTICRAVQHAKVFPDS